MKDRTRILCLIIGPLLFLFSASTLSGVLTSCGALAFGTLLWMVFWWVTRPIHMTITAFLPVVVNALFPMTPMSSILPHYASSSIVLIFGAGLLSMAWERTGLDRRIALKALSLIGPSIRSQITVWFIASVALSTLMPNVAVCALYCPIAVAMLKAAGYEDVSKCPHAAPILLCIGWGAGIGGVGSPLGGAMNITAITYLQKYTGCEFMYIDWLVRNVPYMIIVSLVMLLCMQHIGKGCAPLAGTKAYFNRLLSEMPPMSRDEKISGILFIIAVTASFCRPLYASILPNTEPAFIFLVFGFLMFLITGSDKKPLVSWETAQRESLWGMMLLFGGGIALGNLINESGAASGLAALLGRLNLRGGFGTALLFALAAVMLAELTNSTVAAAVIVPIAISITTSLGLNPIPYWFIITLAYNAEFLLPVSVRAIPVSYGLSADIMLKKGVPMVIIRLAVALLFGYALMTLWPDYGTLSNWTFTP